MRYLALGDSYTIGTGASDDSHAWPSIIASRLGADLTNPAVNGYTTLDLIREELPYLGRVEHDFVSILIGVNDLVQDRKSTRLNSSHPSISTLSLHDALPIWRLLHDRHRRLRRLPRLALHHRVAPRRRPDEPGRQRLHHARPHPRGTPVSRPRGARFRVDLDRGQRPGPRSEEHTSELQSPVHLHSFPTRRSSDLATPTRSAPAPPTTPTPGPPSSRRASAQT